MGAVTLASKTVTLIDSMIQADQGASYRKHLGLVIPHIGDAYRSTEESHRSHLGASLLGGECARAIWYGFRWSTKKKFDGRILRLFNRGHLEEARFIAMLLMIGCEVYQQDANGKQYRISFAEGHAGGSGDGITIGIPDLPPGTPCLAEFKTHSDKSFAELKAKGVRDAKFEHYVQTMTYMRKMGIPVCLYMGVNKNNDELYGEILTLNTDVADQFIDRGTNLVWMQDPPAKLNESPGFFKCRFCDHKPVCHNGAEPDRNCRTCEYSMPGKDATWICRLHDSVIDKEVQFTGCKDYVKKSCFK